MDDSATTFNFPSLPQLFQKRFAEMVETQTAQKFFTTNKAAAEFSKHRTILRNLMIGFTDHGITYSPAVKDIKCTEVAETVLIVRRVQTNIPADISILPISFSKLIICSSRFQFNEIKSITEHPQMKHFHFESTIDLGEQDIPLITFNSFFDRLTKIDKVVLMVFLKGSEKNKNQFMESLKNYENSLNIDQKNRLIISTRNTKTVFDK